MKHTIFLLDVFEIKQDVNPDNMRRKSKCPRDPLRQQWGHKTRNGKGVVGRVYKKGKKNGKK